MSQMDDFDFDDRIGAIRELMEFAVPSRHQSDAAEVLELYRDDRIVLGLLQEFYSFLPEAHEDWIREIRVISRQQGMHLLLAVTGLSNYIYLVSSEGIEFQGTLAEGIWDHEVLDFFDIDNPKDQLAGHTVEELYPVYEAMGGDAEVCPACHAVTGEDHVFGCPVEICPWCNGQFVYCDCRYEKLGLESISSEEELAALEQLLKKQGRIPYSPDQRPSFPMEE